MSREITRITPPCPLSEEVGLRTSESCNKHFANLLTSKEKKPQSQWLFNLRQSLPESVLTDKIKPAIKVLKDTRLGLETGLTVRHVPTTSKQSSARQKWKHQNKALPKKPTNQSAEQAVQMLSFGDTHSVTEPCPHRNEHHCPA